MKRGVVVWITGLPSAGKSTLAQTVFQELEKVEEQPCVLDGDVVRKVLFPNLGYSEADRAEFYGSLARLAALLAKQGLVVLVPATAHRRAFREQCREIAPAFIELHVDTPVEECRSRDSKGLYAGSDGGHERHVPGANLTYERPLAPDVVARDGRDRDAVVRVVRKILDVVQG